MLTSGVATIAVIAFLAVPTAALGASHQSPGASTTSLAASPSMVASGQPATLSGTATSVAAGASVELYASPYPFTAVTAVASTTTAADGSFSFTVTPDRNTQYSAAVSGVSSPSVTVLVTGQAVTKVKALTLGRAKVVVVIFHPRDLQWGNARVSWSFAAGRRGRFARAAGTRSVNLSPYAVVLFTTATLPAGHFRWRACLHAPEAQALANPTLPPGCTGRGYSGGGYLPIGFPGPVAIARAERYLQSRMGNTALAIVDSEGRLSGVNLNEQFITGSVVKAMLLVAYLRRLNAMGQHYVDSYSNSFLYPMINVSDNDAATKCWSIVGNAGLYAVAQAAGMTHFSIDTTASWGGSWGAALITAADQARFFFEMDSLIPREFVGYANYLLSTIAGYESWGIPAIARPLGYTVYFKAGWRPSPDVFLVHQIARLVGHHHTFAMAVMTDGDPDMSYGIDTIQGVTAALLR
ncbi:MAG TPA: hypothetical protein VME22_27085 [Solirubrobacteraceae bacterium]|nr:hypothetical protein [Solirubrobacteraceae bacterium]